MLVTHTVLMEFSIKVAELCEVDELHDNITHNDQHIFTKHVSHISNQTEYTFFMQEGLWGAPPQWSRVLVTYSCPAGYCNCTGSPRENSTEGCALIYSSPGLSCHPKRSGKLG